MPLAHSAVLVITVALSPTPADADRPALLDPPGWEPPVSGAELTEPPRRPRHAGPWTLFLNFDGADLSACGYNDPKTNCTRWWNDTIEPYGGTAIDRAVLAQEVRSDVEPFDLIVTDQRPSADVDYDMEMIGDFATRTFAEGVGGIAPDGYDCFNSQGGDISYTFETFGSLGQREISFPITTHAILQELAHSWGLEHVESSRDVLYPVAGTGVNPTFVDECLQITTSPVETGETAVPTTARCPTMHAMHCTEPDQQNSYQDMMAMFGPHVPDLTAPTVVIREPMDGASTETSFELVISLSDNDSPQVYDLRVFLDDQQGAAGAYADPMLTFPIMNLPDGEHSLRVEATDEDGNAAQDEVTFTVGVKPDGTGDTGHDGGTDETGGHVDSTGDDGDGSGSGDDPGSDETTTGGSGCSCRSLASTTAGWGVFVMLAPLSRRRGNRSRRLGNLLVARAEP